MLPENIEKEGRIKVSGRRSKRCRKSGKKTETTKER